MLTFRRTPVTLVMAAIAIAVELVCTLRPEMRLYYYNDLRLGILSPVWNGEWWRPLTTTLLHGHLVHAAFNVYWLVILGGWIETQWGWLKYLAMTLLLSYVCCMPEFVLSNLSSPFDAQQGMVGLSGVVYGWFGLLWLGRRWRPEFEAVCPRSTVEIFIFWFVFCWVAAYVGMFNVANVAHGAGWLFGALYAAALYAPKYRGWWRLAAATASSLVLATLLGVPGHPLYEQHRFLQQLRQQVQELSSHEFSPFSMDGSTKSRIARSGQQTEILAQLAVPMGKRTKSHIARSVHQGMERPDGSVDC